MMANQAGNIQIVFHDKDLLVPVHCELDRRRAAPQFLCAERSSSNPTHRSGQLTQEMLKECETMELRQEKADTHDSKSFNFLTTLLQHSTSTFPLRFQPCKGGK